MNNFSNTGIQKNKIVALLTIFCGLLSADLSAAGKYHIELIVFAQNAPNTEIFNQTKSQIRWPQRLVELSGDRLPSSTLIRTENKALNSVYGQLVRNSSYTPLMHVAWIQSINKDSKSDPVHVFTAGGLNGQYPVNGHVSLERGNYLHLNVEMEYAKDSLIYHLNQRRRIRLNEVHYLDHPKFGVIAIVKPLVGSVHAE